MSRNKNNRTLIIIFVALLAVFAINLIIKKSRGERSFRDDIIEFQASEIHRIVFFPRGGMGQEVELKKTDTIWKLKAGGKEFAADQELTNGIVEELAYITPDRLVGNSKDLWKEYDVTDSAGTKVVVYGPKKSKTELVIGRFMYNQATRKPSTFLRLNNDNQIFAVEGYLSMTFNRGINDLRNKTLYKGNRNDITSISFNYPSDSSFTLTKENNQWLCNGIATDSAKTVNYLNAITYLTGTDFRDDFQPVGAPVELYKIRIEGINMPPAEFVVYNDPAGPVLVSSENKGTYFGDKSGDLLRRIFKGKAAFLPTP